VVWIECIIPKPYTLTMQASGCKDRHMLVEANRCMANAIKHIMNLPLPEGYRPLMHADNILPEQLEEQVNPKP
jgi:hypothetical protein